MHRRLLLKYGTTSYDWSLARHGPSLPLGLTTCDPDVVFDSGVEGGCSQRPRWARQEIWSLKDRPSPVPARFLDFVNLCVCVRVCVCVCVYMSVCACARLSVVGDRIVRAHMLVCVCVCVCACKCTCT